MVTAVLMKAVLMTAFGDCSAVVMSSGVDFDVIDCFAGDCLDGDWGDGD